VSVRLSLSYRAKVLRPARHEIVHFGDVLLSQSLDLVLKKLSPKKQKQARQEQNGKNLEKGTAER